MDLSSVFQNNSQSTSNESTVEERKASIWVLRGPPFDPRDYMISPSESEIASYASKRVEESTATAYRNLQPSEVRVDSKYILDWRGSLKKLLELTDVECVQPLLDRIQNLIRGYLKGCPAGFPLEDLPSIIQLLEYFSEKQKSVVEFKNHVMVILDFAKKPPIISKGLDIVRSKKNLTDYFTMFGELLAALEDECFQIQILQALDSIIFRRNLSDLGSVKLSLCIEAMEESQLPYAVAALLETVSSNLYVYYLEIAINMTLVSVKAGILMLRNNIINSVLKRLSLFDCPSLSEEESGDAEYLNRLNQYYVMLDKTSFLMWGLLAIISKNDMEIPSPDSDALRFLKNIFEREIMKKSQRALYARNNIAGIIIKLSSVFNERLPLHRAGWVEDIAVLSVASELGTQESCLEGCTLGTKKEDFCLKKLMLLGCCLLPKKKEEFEVLKNFRVIEGILTLISCQVPDPWVPSQFFCLFQISLRTISELVTVFPEEFVRCKVSTIILSLMQRYKKDVFEENILQEILMTFYNIVSCDNNECIIEDIKEQNGERILFELYNYLINIESMKIEDQVKLSKVLIVLAKLLKNDEKLLDSHSHCVASNTTALLQRLLQDSSRDSKWDPKLLISFGVFIWESIALCNKTLKKFIEQGGIFLLLDFIESSIFPVQMFFLGILVEMTLEGENIAHLLTWRGKEGYGMLDLMINIWRKEEYFTKVLRTPQGFIDDIEKPLMTEEQWLVTLEIENGHNYCASVAEMVGSARPKIHALYHFLHDQYSDLTELSESSYSLKFLNVQPSNQVYIPLVEHYLSLKMGEVWYEVLRDIHINGIIPTAFDGDVMCTLLEDKKHWSCRIKTMQEEIASFQQDSVTGADQEKGFYKLLHACRLTPALEALRHLDYVGRTSLRKFQSERKSRQIKIVEKSLENIGVLPERDIHRTFLSNTNVTFMELGKIFIKSEKEVSVREELIPVSSDSSQDDYFDSGDDL